jgi:hypothetical protein
VLHHDAGVTLILELCGRGRCEENSAMGAPTREANPPSPELLRGGDRCEATNRTAQEPNQPRTSTPSLICFLLRSAFPFVEPVTTVLLLRPEAQGEPSTPFTLLWTRPSSRG